MNPSIPPILNSAPGAISPAQLTGSAIAPTTSRIPKRIVSVVFVLSLLGGLVWATSPRPRLSRQNESISAWIEPATKQVATQFDIDVQTTIDRQRLQTAPQADWRAIARRLSLALVGNSLSLEEIRVLEQVPEVDRVAWWTDYLLHDRRSADYLAERWTRATVGTNNGPFLIFRRRKYVHWLSDQFEKNTPMDAVVRDLITSKGSWTDAPQVNFLTATMDDADNKRPDAVRLAGRTSRAFLAQRIDCLQCHQDYLGKVNFTDSINESSDRSIQDSADQDSTVRARSGEQADFHQLAAFFSSVRMENPFVGLENTDPDYKIKYLHSESETEVPATVPYLRELLPDQGTEREKLATWVTHPRNKAFARATVNRTWAIMCGRPLIEPIDSIPLSGPFPAGFERLSDSFIESGFDMRRLIKTIACTQVFQRDSRFEENAANQEIDERHEQAWAVFPLTQLRPEQVAASIHQSSRIKAIDGNSSILSQLELFGSVNDFTKAYGDRGDDEFESQTVTIPQRLLVMNGSFVSERINHNPIANASTRIAELTTDDRVAIESAYLSVLNRLPSSREREAFTDRLCDKQGNARANAIGSLFWTLINSTEFQWNH
jgi:hypothetical protein